MIQMLLGLKSVHRMPLRALQGFSTILRRLALPVPHRVPIIQHFGEPVIENPCVGGSIPP
jgi:hypothetical protein